MTQLKDRTPGPWMLKREPVPLADLAEAVKCTARRRTLDEWIVTLEYRGRNLSFPISCDPPEEWDEEDFTSFETLRDWLGDMDEYNVQDVEGGIVGFGYLFGQDYLLFRESARAEYLEEQKRDEQRLEESTHATELDDTLQPSP